MDGIIYGLDETPKQCIDTLIKKDYLINLSNKLENLKDERYIIYKNNKRII